MPLIVATKIHCPKGHGSSKAFCQNPWEKHVKRLTSQTFLIEESNVGFRIAQSHGTMAE